MELMLYGMVAFLWIALYLIIALITWLPLHRMKLGIFAAIIALVWSAIATGALWYLTDTDGSKLLRLIILVAALGIPIKLEAYLPVHPNEDDGNKE